MLYLLQFACLIFMFISAFFIAVTRLHVRWINRRYEWSRWMIFSALLFMAVHFFLQMYFGFRAMGAAVGPSSTCWFTCLASRLSQWLSTTSRLPIPSAVR